MTKENAIHRLLLFRHRKGNTELLNESLDMAIEALRQPERKTGEWVKFPQPLDEVYQCTNCKAGTWQRWAIGLQGCKTFYCPWCGADMRGDKHEVD